MKSKPPPGYGIWAGMKKRCNNPNSPKYSFYGGRGIKVCERWHSFKSFIADMGPPPEGLTLDRIDSDGDYEPGNCRWATWEQQHNNKRSNRRITVGKRTQTVAQWAREAGLSKAALAGRLDRGWAPGDAVSMPPDRLKKKLTWDQAVEIAKRMFRGEFGSSIAAQFGVNRNLPGLIARGIKWRGANEEARDQDLNLNPTGEPKQ